MKKILFFLLLVFIHFAAYTQQTLTVTVFDKSSEKPLPFVDGSCKNDSLAFKKIFVTDEDGKYIFRKLIKSTYKFTFSYTGYNTFDTIVEIKGQKDETLTVNLSTQFKDLNEVNVNATKPFLEMSKGKFILNVQESALAKSQNAWNALQYAPTVVTTMTGVLTVMNMPAVVYIDDRRIYFSGEELMRYLQNIPANNIDKIEIISHPDASYSSDVATVIKISTTKLRFEGLKGNLSLGGTQATFFKYNLGGNIDYKKGKFTLQSGYSFNHSKSETAITYQETISTNFDWTIPQKTESLGNYHNANATMGYDFNENNKLTVYASLPISQSNSQMNSNNGLPTPERLGDSIFIFNSNNKIKSNSFQTQINYETKFDSGKQDIKFQFEYFRNKQDYKNNYIDSVYDFNLDNYKLGYNKTDKLPQNLNTYVGTVTNSTQLFKGDFTYGLQYYGNDLIINNSTFDNTIIPNNLINSQLVKYKENKYAGYGSWDKQIKKIYLLIGLRLEDDKVAAKSDSVNAEVDYKWFNIFPNLLIQYSKSDKSTWLLNYNKTFQRPDYYLLNPYQRFTDNSAALFQGNAQIRPQKNHNLTIEWTNNKSIALYTGFEIYKDMITTFYLHDSITSNLIRNYVNSYLVGIYIGAYYGFNILKIWKLSFDGYALFYKTKYSNIIPSRTSPIITFNLTNSFTIKKILQLEINTFYQPTYTDGYYTHYGYGYVNLTLSKDFKKPNCTVSIYGNDILKNEIFKEKCLYLNFNSSGAYYDSRQFGVSFTWRFGKQTVKVDKDIKLQSDESKNRLKN